MPLQHPSNSIHSYLMRPWQMTWFIYSFDSWAIFSHLFIARLKIFANACAMCRCVSECANKSVEFIQHLHNLIFQIYYCRFFLNVWIKWNSSVIAPFVMFFVLKSSTSCARTEGKKNLLIRLILYHALNWNEMDYKKCKPSKFKGLSY